MLPIYYTDETDVNRIQATWSALLNPLLNNALTNGLLLKNTTLQSGTNQVNHKLGRKLQGWFLIRKRAASDIFDAQDANQNPQLTLTLVSSATVTVDLYVF